MAAILEFEKEQTSPETRFTPSDVEITCRLLADSSNRLEEKVGFLERRQRNRTRYKISAFLLFAVLLVSLKWFNNSATVLAILFGILGAATIVGITGVAGTRPTIEMETVGISSKIERYLQIASQFEEYGRISRMQKMELDFRMAEAEDLLKRARRFYGLNAVSK